MKLHLTKSLRQALLACVCGCVGAVGQAVAETTTVDSSNVAEYAALSTYTIAAGDTLSITAGNYNSNQDYSSSTAITLAGGTLSLGLSWGSRDGTGDEYAQRGTITLDCASVDVNGDGVVNEKDYSTLMGTTSTLYTNGISGNGNLLIKSSDSSKTFYLVGEITNTGSLILDGNLVFGGGYSNEEGYSNPALINNVGTVTINGTTTIGSNGAFGSNVTNVIVADGGTLNIGASGPQRDVNGDGTYDVRDGVIKNDLTVNAGGTLKLNASDALGVWHDSCATNSNYANRVDTIILSGAADKLATMQVNAAQTLSSTIKLNGYTSIEGSSYLVFHNGQIEASGINNSITTQLNTKWDINLTVQSAGELTLAAGVVQSSGSSGILQKRGDGTLILASGASVASDVTFNINAGVVDIQAPSSSGVSAVKGTMNVAAGATLKLSASDALGYYGTGADATDTINLTGSKTETTNAETGVTTTTYSLATLKVNDHQTLSTNINLKGNTQIVSDTTSVTVDDGNGGTTTEEVKLGDLTAYGNSSSITATGTNNTIDTTLKTRDELRVVVTNATDELTITGNVEKSVVTGSSNDLVKSGDGTLIIGKTANIASGVDLVVNDGTLKFAEALRTIDSAITVASGAKVIADETTLSKLTLGGGELAVAASHSASGTVTVDSKGGTISATTYSAWNGNVTGAGDVTLDGSTTAEGKGLDVGGTINNTGEVTIENRVYMKSGSSFGENVEAVNVTEDAILDLSNVATFNAQELDLASDSTLVMGNSVLDMSDTLTTKLTVEEGAIINLGAWNTNVYDYARETVLFTGVEEVSWTGDSVAVWIDFGDGKLWQNWLIYDAENKTVYSIPEPATATLSLLALAGLAARRRRK